MRQRKDRLRISKLPIIAFLIIVFLWEVIDYSFSIREVILPNPHEILSSIIANGDILIKHTGITMFESVFGFVIGSSIGILTALLFVYSAKSKEALYPYAIALKATPLYALAPLLIVWFGGGLLSKVVMSALVAFFPVLVNAFKGFTSVEQESFDLFKSLSASKWQMFIRLRFPNSLPYIFPALKISTTLAVVGATIAEFTGASQGVGHLIVNASYYLETSLMFAGIVMISLGGILFFYLVGFIERKVVFWQRAE